MVSRRSQNLSKMENLPLLGNPKNIGQYNCFEPYEQECGQEEQYYHLKWHNHQSNLTFELAELQQFETFVDVTLSTMDGNSINCHKVCKQLKYLVLDLVILKLKIVISVFDNFLSQPGCPACCLILLCPTIRKICGTWRY